MHLQLLSQSPLLILPLFALFIFVGVFLSVALRALLTSRPTLDALASIPLADETEVRHEA